MESLVCRYCQKMDKELIKNPSGAEVQYFDGRNGQLTEENKKKHASEPKLREIPNKQTNLSSIQPPASRCGWSGFFHNLNDDRGPVIKSSFRGVEKNRPTLRQVLHTHNRTWIQPSTNPKYRFPLFLGSTEHIYGIRSF